MVKRNVLIEDFGGSVVIISDTLQMENNGDYKELARIQKWNGEILWFVNYPHIPNENENEDPALNGTIKEIVDRAAEPFKLKNYGNNKLNRLNVLYKLEKYCGISYAEQHELFSLINDIREKGMEITDELLSH